MNRINKNKMPVIIASIQWFLSTIFQLDRLFFTYDNETRIFIQVKILYFVLLIIFWHFLFFVHKKIKEKNEYYIWGFHIFTFYLTVMMILLTILWPGTWAWDDLWALNSIQYYTSLNPWQHIITSYYQDILLQILPFPGGIILLQNIIISVCVAFTITKLEVCFKIKKLKYRTVDTLIKILPFLLPPVLMYQFSGYRIGLYLYLELTMLVILICAIKDEKEWSMSYLIFFCFLCVVVAAWRTESFFYILFSSILIYLTKKVVIPNKKKIVCIILLITGFISINRLQSDALGNSNYKIISLLRPCTELVRVADNIEDAELLSNIDKVVATDVIHNNPDFHGETLYWGYDVVKVDYTDQDYKSFLKAFIRLSLKYPKVVIAERWNLFILGSGITGQSSTNVNQAAALFDENSNNRAAAATLAREWVTDTPVFKTTRKTLINALGIKKNDGTFIGSFQRVVWNAIIPLLILIYAWIKMLCKKKWYFLLICTAILIRVPIVILTQPSGWIMYMLSFYFLGYVYLIYQLLIYRSNRKQVNIL